MEAINEIAKRDNAKIYTTKEVADNIDLINLIIVKQGDVIYLGDVKIKIPKYEGRKEDSTHIFTPEEIEIILNRFRNSHCILYRITI